MKKIIIALALLLASNAAEARLHHQHRQARPAVQAAAVIPPPFARVFGYDSEAKQELRKATRPPQHPPRPYARQRPPVALYAHHRIRAHRWMAAREDVAPRHRRRHAWSPWPSHHYARQDVATPKVMAYAPAAPKASGPALYALTKVTAMALGVTDDSLLFGKLSVARRPHLSPIVPWAGALSY
jgi:hypothetical protein